MAGGKETPRQKMIGMMYLVLTALLAMNVSKEILDAFVSINSSLVKNSATFDQTNNSTYGEFENKNAANPAKVGPFLSKANQVKTAAGELSAYINEMKARVMAISHTHNMENFKDFMDESGKAVPLDHILITKKDENQEATAMLYGGHPQEAEDKPWGCLELKKKLTEYGTLLSGIALSQRVKNGVTTTFTFEDGVDADGKTVKWENVRFFHSPLAAVITELSTIESNVKRAESEVVADLYSNIDAASYKFTDLAAVVIPKSNYVLRGDTFQAKIFLSAFDATNSPRIYMDNQKWNGTDTTRFKPAQGAAPLKIDKDGYGILKIPANSLGIGEFSYKGLIEYDGPTDMVVKSVYVPPFTVAEPALVVSPTKMNVFYRGLDNPVEISVPGIPQDKLVVNISGDGHKIERKGNEFVVRPGAGKDAKISVVATMSDGSKQNMGEKSFRVKPIPDPVPSIQSKRPSDSSIALGDLKAASGIKAEMESFDFEVQVAVQSFTMLNVKNGIVTDINATGNKLTSEMTQVIGKLAKGNQIFFQNILVKMPDGSTRKLSNLAFKIS